MKDIFKKQDLKRFVKYWVGSWLYFWLGYGVFALGYSVFHWGWLPAKVLADTIGWSSNYVAQRFWAFSDRINLREMEHAARYLIVEGVGFVLDYLIIWGLKSIGISPYIGFFISALFFVFWSWFWYKYWVFPEHKNIKKAS